MSGSWCVEHDAVRKPLLLPPFSLLLPAFSLSLFWKGGSGAIQHSFEAFALVVSFPPPQTEFVRVANLFSASEKSVTSGSSG